MARAMGSKMPLMRARESLEMVMAASTRAGDAEDGPLAFGDLAERLGAEGADGLASDPARLDQAGDPQALEVVADERLAEARRGR